MVSHLSVAVRLLIVASAFLPWLVLYLVAGRSISLPAVEPWLRWISFVLLGLSIILYALDYTHLSTTLSLYGWGLFGAMNWLRNRYKLYPPPAVTSLNISGHEPASSLR